MGHTYATILVHCVFSTKEREPCLSEEIQERLWPYMGGIARTNECAALGVNGTKDHCHM